jgi:transcriptional regulator with XRE-family HTH domain
MRRLAGELRRLRAAAGLSQEDVEERCGVTAATLYRLENAKTRPQQRTLQALMQTYGVPDSQQPALAALARRSGEQDWLQPYMSLIPEEYSTYIQFEAEATSVRVYESLFIPGLLQTMHYTEASIQGDNPTWGPEDVGLQTKIRLGRQNLLTRSDPLQLWAIVDEAALHRQVGGAETMQEQYRHLLAVTESPSIVFQVVPFTAGAHPGMSGSFSILDFTTPDPTVTCIESTAGPLFLQTESDVAWCTLKFDHLRATALSPTETTRMVNDLLR